MGGIFNSIFLWENSYYTHDLYFIRLQLVGWPFTLIGDSNEERNVFKKDILSTRYMKNKAKEMEHNFFFLS